MRNGFRIGVNAFRESLREPVYVLIFFTVLAIVGIYPATADFVFYEEQKFVADGAMATIWLGALLLSALCAGNSISRELRNGSVLMALSKPVSRFSYLAGKISGVTAATLFFGISAAAAALTALSVATDAFRFDGRLVAAAYAVLVFAAVFAMAANFLKGASFSEYASLAGGILSIAWCILRLAGAETLPFDLAEAVKVSVALLGAITLLSVLAAATAFFFDLVPTLGIMLGFFMAGSISRYLFCRDTGIAALNAILRGVYAWIPDWQFFWLTDALAMKRPIPWSYLAGVWGYALSLIALIMIGTHFCFVRREAEPGKNR
ncbi:MAG: hypothetical protein MJ016_04460 [Victivallaceae bacterium]|nr:hypothetical protein [Victivallaceae bacterium]